MSKLCQFYQLETDKRLIAIRIKNISKRLEKVHKQRDLGRKSRLKNELPKCASIESLYFEPLHSHRHGRKLNLFCKIRNNDSPLYLYDCIMALYR
jgi:hypothetical protein